LSTWSQPDTQGKILVVEDDALNAEFLYKYLSKLGYQVINASNGREGLQQTSQISPDLILVDAMMPVMDGFEFCEQVRRNPETSHIPVLMVTALYATEERVKALESGASDFLSKPFSTYELAARVKSLLRIKHQHDELERRNKLFHDVIRSYVAPEVSEQILKNPQRYLKLGGESRQVTTLFADIRGFTSYAQTHSPTRVVEILNLVFKELTEVIFRWRGTFDKYLGDSIMAIYGAPVSYQDDALRAIRTALDMQAAFNALRERWTDEKERGLGLGIGMNTGEAVVGNIGTELLMDYTVVGDTVNIAQRLEELAQGGQTLLTEATYEQVGRRAQVIPYGTQVLRGRQEETKIYQLIDML
jgi:adenylate cyclase